MKNLIQSLQHSMEVMVGENTNVKIIEYRPKPVNNIKKLNDTVKDAKSDDPKAIQRLSERINAHTDPSKKARYVDKLKRKGFDVTKAQSDTVATKKPRTTMSNMLPSATGMTSKDKGSA